MSKRQKMTPGVPFRINHRIVDFSFFPVYVPKKRATMHTVMYASNPWSIFRIEAKGKFSEGSDDYVMVNSFIDQSEDYYRSAKNSGNSQTTPLLFYYSFLNLGKALSKIRSNNDLMGNVSHGIHANNAYDKTVEAAVLVNENLRPNKLNAIKEISSAFNISNRFDIFSTNDNKIKELFQQIVIGQRLFVEGIGGNRRVEKFLQVDKIEFMQNEGKTEMWIRLLIAKDKFTGEARGQNDVLSKSSLDDNFVIVTDENLSNDYVIFESKSVLSVDSQNARDNLPNLVDTIRPYLWEVIMTGDSLRKYYIYLADCNEKVYPQWFSTYAGFFWLGYLSRYFPAELVKLQDSDFGPFLAEFIESQPQQLLYLMASEVKQQVVTKSNII